MNRNRILSILSDYKNGITDINDTADLILKHHKFTNLRIGYYQPEKMEGKCTPPPERP